jgi:hypothetical protein
VPTSDQPVEERAGGDCKIQQWLEGSPEGDSDGSFKAIDDYLQRITEANPGSRLVFNKDGNFSRCFIGLEDYRLALEWCVPIISLDACAIKNK